MTEQNFDGIQEFLGNSNGIDRIYSFTNLHKCVKPLRVNNTNLSSENIWPHC
jgi:hypothetical protein